MQYNIDLAVISKNKNKRLKKSPPLLKNNQQDNGDDDDVKNNNNNKRTRIDFVIKKVGNIIYLYILYKKKRQILFSCFILYIHSCFCTCINSNCFDSSTKCFTINRLLGIEIIEWITYLG